MQYLLLAYGDAPGEEDRVGERELREGGYLLAWARVAEGGASVVRVRGDEVVVEEDPRRLGDGQLCMVLWIEARDLNEAIRVAARLPQACSGWVEVKETVRLSGKMAD